MKIINVTLLFMPGCEQQQSEEMAEFNYNELCFAFDSFYGLKETHNIESFDKFAAENGLKQLFINTDPLMHRFRPLRDHNTFSRRYTQYF